MMPGSKSSKKISVLIIESDDSDTKLIEKCLKESDRGPFDLEFYPTLKQGLDRFKKWRGDVIILDLILKDSSGIETFKKVKSQAPPFVPIVVLSRSDDDQEALEAVRLGAQDYLVKEVLNKKNLSRVLRYAIERRKSQEEVYIAEEKYRTIFENSAAAIMLVDNQERMISWNRFMENLLGMQHKDLYLKKADMIFPEDEWAKICQRSLSMKNGSDKHFETKAKKKSGDLIDVDLSLSILKDADEKLSGSIVIMQDITERKRLEAVKDEFISTVSHELRTPMTIIREGVSQLHEGILGKTTEAQNQILVITLESIDRLARMINDLLDISRLEAGKMQIYKRAFNLVDAVAEVCLAFSPLSKEKNIQLEPIAVKKGIEVNADRDKIIQIITNLIGNAFKFTKKGKIEVRIEETAKEVCASVSDTGRGIAQQDLPKVFDKFQQFGREVGPGEKGTGLGLAICKRIIELHQGRIWVESQTGKGSKFTFALPK